MNWENMFSPLNQSVKGKVNVMRFAIIIWIFSTLIFGAKAAFSKEKIIYKYKEYEKFDLGDLQIKGNIIAPGDLSVKQRRRKVFERNIFQKRNFQKEIITEIKFLR